MIDKATEKVLNDSEKLQELIKSDGWAIARKMLWTRITSLSDVLSLDSSDPQKLAFDIAVRQKLVQELIGWFKEVEGTAKQGMDNKELMLKYREEEYTVFFDKSNPTE